MVIDYGGTRIGEALQGKTQLDQAGARILGVVMNKIPTGRRGYSYYYYYYNRDYYYDGDGSGKRRRSRRSGSSTKSETSTPLAETLPASLEPSNK